MGQFLLLLLLLFGGKQRVDSIAYKNWIDCVGFSIMNALREFTFLFFFCSNIHVQTLWTNEWISNLFIFYFFKFLIQKIFWGMWENMDDIRLILWKLLCNCMWWLNDEWKHERETTHKVFRGSDKWTMSTMRKPMMATYYIKHLFYNEPNVEFIYERIIN